MSSIRVEPTCMFIGKDIYCYYWALCFNIHLQWVYKKVCNLIVKMWTITSDVIIGGNDDQGLSNHKYIFFLCWRIQITSYSVRSPIRFNPLVNSKLVPESISDLLNSRFERIIIFFLIKIVWTKSIQFFFSFFLSKNYKFHVQN